MSNEKVNEALAKGKELYNKGNEMMDKVSVLKKPLYKKIVWGVLGVICLLVVGRIFGCCGLGGAQSPFDVCKETMIAVFDGDLETVFENMYIPPEEQEKLAKLSGAEAELLEKEMVESLMKPFASMSKEDRALAKAAYKSMKHKDTKIEGDEATVTHVVTFMGQEKEDSATLRKVDGKWKVDMSK